MSSNTTNLTTRKSAGQLPSLTEVYSLADLPVAASGVRDFAMNQGLNLKAQVVDTNVWRWPAGSSITIRADDQVPTAPVYVGSGTFINCLGATATVEFNNVLFLNVTGGARFCDLTAGTPPPGVTFNLVFLKAGFINFTRGGSLTGYTAGSFKEWFLSGLAEQFTLNSCQAMDVSACFFSGSGAGKRPLFGVQGPYTFQCNVHHSFLNAGGAQSSLSIERSVTTNGFVIMSADVNGVPGGTFYKPTAQHTITNTSVNTFVSDILTVSAGTNGEARFFHDSPSPPLIPGDIIEHTGFITQTSYLGNFVVVDVDLVGTSYTVGTIATRGFVAFVDTEVGIMSRLYSNILIADTTDIIVGDGVEITGTTNYNGEHAVKLIDPNVSFAIAVPFPGAEVAGTVTAGSLTERDNRVDVSNSGKVKSSESIALANLNGSVTTTSTSDGQFDVLNLAGLVEGLVTERFELTNATTGTFTYQGANRFEGFLTGSLSALKSGSTQNYRFAMSLNGGEPLFNAIGSTAISSVITSPLNSGIARFVHALVPGPSIGSFVTLTGFTSNPNYNTTGLCIFADSTNFELDQVTFGTTDTGNFTVAEANYVPMEVKTSKVIIPLLFSANLRPGDTIAIWLSGDGTSDTLTVTDLTFGVQ